MKLKLTIVALALALMAGSCEKKENETAENPQQVQQAQPAPTPQQHVHQPAAALAHTGVVQEVLQANAYTYLKVKEDDQAFWIAVTKRETKVGETISFSQGLAMPNFESKDLQRTFDLVYFVAEASNAQASTTRASHPPMGTQTAVDTQTALMAHHKKPAVEKVDISIEPAEGGISLAALFANRDTHASQSVTVKGKVTKVNRAIMGKNWVHLQDGTSASGVYDLTITTQDEAKVGEIATFTGTITLNKDFGSGYSYEIIMEDAKKVKEE